MTKRNCVLRTRNFTESSCPCSFKITKRPFIRTCSEIGRLRRSQQFPLQGRTRFLKPRWEHSRQKRAGISNLSGIEGPSFKYMPALEDRARTNLLNKAGRHPLGRVRSKLPRSAETSNLSESKALPSKHALRFEYGLTLRSRTWFPRPR
jgi:hypothetical protein